MSLKRNFQNSLQNPNVQKQIRKLTALSLAIAFSIVSLNYIADFNLFANTGSGLSAEYFNNANFTDLKVSKIDDAVDFNWDVGTPDSSIDPELYSIRWSGQIKPRYSETYTFSTLSDDGIRLWINGQLLIDKWNDHPVTMDFGTITLLADTLYDIKIEYYENTGHSVAKLFWQSPTQPREIVPKSQLYSNKVFAAFKKSEVVRPVDGHGLRAEYFDDYNFKQLNLSRTDSQINFDWRYGSPDNSIQKDTFAVRWTGQIQPEASEEYTFYTSSDDGVRLWINNQLVIDNWNDHSVTENLGKIALTAGQNYSIKLEYYENWGEAAIILSWSSSSLGKQIVPSNRLFAAEQNQSPQIESVTTNSNPIIEPPQPTTTSNVSSAPVELGQFFVNPYSQAKNWLNSNQSSAVASLIEKMASQPTAQWLGGWNWNLYDDVSKTVNTAAQSGTTPIFVAYNIPQRDCGGYSAGGVGSPDAYKSWIETMASAISNKKAIVVLEPDALSNIDCLSASDQEVRLNLIKTAVSKLKQGGNTAVYIDAGHSGWIQADTMAERLKKAGIESADGFALNTSNYISTPENKDYGKKITSKVGKKFVIDTSRNGAGATSDNQWCNPWGRALGQPPTTATGDSDVAAYLWIKAPGESDGNCNGGPSAGTFWPEYAAELARKSGW